MKIARSRRKSANIGIQGHLNSGSYKKMHKQRAKHKAKELKPPPTTAETDVNVGSSERGSAGSSIDTVRMLRKLLLHVMCSCVKYASWLAQSAPSVL